MEQITMVKYTAEQIDQVLALLTTVASDTKSYQCSLPMMSVILDINNFLRNNAEVYTVDSVAEHEDSEETNDAEEVVLSGGGAE